MIMINFWKRFSISLLGRVRVTKTFLISQFTYRGTILEFIDAQYNKIDKLWSDFIRNNDRFLSEERVFGCKEGGACSPPLKTI